MSYDFYQALYNEIMTGPKAAECAPFVHSNEMPKISGAEAAEKDNAIATILNQDRTKIVSKEIGDGMLSLALGLPDGPVFVYKLKQLAATQLPVDAPIEQVTPVAVAQQAVNSLAKGGFDIGNPGVRAAIDSFVGSLLTADQAQDIKAIAEVPDVLTAAQIGKAIRGPWN